MPAALCTLLTGLAAAAPLSLPDIEEPAVLAADGNEIYILDGHTVNAYSLHPFNLRTRFGKEGKGAGEFEYPPRLIPQPGGILANSWVKSSWFSRTGRLLEEKDYYTLKGFDPGLEMRLVPAGDRFVRIIAVHVLNRAFFHLLNAAYEEIAQLYEGPFEWNALSSDPSKLRDYRMLLPYADACASQDRIFIADSGRGFVIEVFDLDGRHLYTIDKNDEIRPVSIDEDYRRRAVAALKASRPEYYEKAPEAAFVFDEHFPAINRIQVSEGRIYVTTYRTKERKHEIVILDPRGKILKRAFLPLRSMNFFSKSPLGVDLYTIDGGRLLELVREEGASRWELHIAEIE